MFTLTSQQGDAISAVKKWFKDVTASNDGGVPPHFYLAGYAGSGKSTILAHIIDGCGLDFDEVAFCAPTGKAAKVMTKKLQDDGAKCFARTIHGTIYIPESSTVAKLEAMQREYNQILASGKWQEAKFREAQKNLRLVERDLERAYKSNACPNFSMNPSPFHKDPVEPRLIVVDEASMVGTEITDDLKSLGLPILAIGDPGQLPPIRDKAGFMTRKPDFFLTEIHRQAADSPIIQLATKIRNQEFLDYGDYGQGVEVIKRRYANDTITDMSRYPQVIVGKNATRWNVTDMIRNTRGFLSPAPQKGEPMMITRNSVKIRQLTNGTPMICAEDVSMKAGETGTIAKVFNEEDKRLYELTVSQGIFEEHIYRDRNGHSLGEGRNRENWWGKENYENLDWHWCITGHKAQGSQWDDVIVYDESSVFGADQYKWLYTSCTRSSSRLTIIR